MLIRSLMENIASPYKEHECVKIKIRMQITQITNQISPDYQKFPKKHYLCNLHSNLYFDTLSFLLSNLHY